MSHSWTCVSASRTKSALARLDVAHSPLDLPSYEKRTSNETLPSFFCPRLGVCQAAEEDENEATRMNLEPSGGGGGGEEGETAAEWGDLPNLKSHSRRRRGEKSE